MRSYVTSYSALFHRVVPDVPTVVRVEIPLIQRDYAQGRVGASVERIRATFVDVLHEAVTGGKPVNLDFVYGDVRDGTLEPLDGQQRLTTLFLLHWYLAFRAERLDQTAGWKNFSYATRSSARLFCQRLAESRPPLRVENVSAWIVDQPWCLYTWIHDPTIQSMLVMLDTIHGRFRDDDCHAAWERLVDPDNPAISFHLLPIEQMGLSEDLYIKMNSRGKPLTAFENFKARFEQVIGKSCAARADEFARKIDGEWSDLLWPYRGPDFAIDDKFLRYLQFILEVCEWRSGQLPEGDIGSLAERVFGLKNSKAGEHLDFLFKAFDTWVKSDIAAAFSNLFTNEVPRGNLPDTGKILLFDLQGVVDLDLFAACCASFGKVSGRNRIFGWPPTLLLYAIILHRTNDTKDFPRRLRVLRNLIEASGNELRSDRMPDLIADVDQIILYGSLENVSAFNQAQVEDERFKADFLDRFPHLERVVFRLEDHPVVRGCLNAFELDEHHLEKRVRLFYDLFSDRACFPALTGALLAMGDYSRRLTLRSWLFGSGTNLAPWRELLTGARRLELSSTRSVLTQLLDALTDSDQNIQIALSDIQTQWLLREPVERGLDWRWYFVRYPAMREGGSGIYVGLHGVLGYFVCMLNKKQMNSWYRDPFISAIHNESGVGSAADEPWFTGYETEPRRLRLKESGIQIQCVEDGFVLLPPAHGLNASFTAVIERYGVGSDWRLKVEQSNREGRLLDAVDRVQLGASLVRDLVEAEGVMSAEPGLEQAGQGS